MFLSKIKISILLISAMVVVIGMAQKVYAQNTNYSLEITTSKSNLTIGEQFLLSIKIAHVKDVQIEKPVYLDIKKPFVVKDYLITPPTTNAKGRVSQNMQYTISIYETGTFVLHPPVFYVISQPNNISNKIPLKIPFKIPLTAKPITMRVESLTSANNTNIQENENITAVKGRISIINISVFILIIVIFIAFIWYVNYYHQKRKQKSALPFEIALSEITKLLEKKYFEKQMYKEFYYQFSRIIRSYLEAISPIPATSMTTSQICSLLKKYRIAHANFYEATCLYADKVKFSTFKPQQKATAKLLKQFHNILFNAQKVAQSKEGDKKS